MKLTHDLPKNQGMENALKRAKLLTDIQWHGSNYIPSCLLVVRAPGGPSVYQETFVPPYFTQQGLLYGNALQTELYLGFTVPLEAFTTALLNPNSVLYTRSYHMAGGAAGCYYGMVCSVFTSYALGLPHRVNTREWALIEGMEEIKDFTCEDLQLCDILNKDGEGAHIVMITDIVRDEQGRVHSLCVSECTPSNCVCRPFTRDQFMAWYFEAEPYQVYRYGHLDKVTYTPNPYFCLPGEDVAEAEDFPLMTNWGHNASVPLHEEPVELTLLHGDWDEFVVTAPDGSTKTYPAGSKVAVKCPTVGNYSACAKKGDKTSASVCWHVHFIKLKTDKLVYKVGEPITITWENLEDDEVYLGRLNATPTGTGRAWQHLSGKSGTATYPGLKKPGNHWANVMAKGEHCSYVSFKAFFEVVE